MNQSLPVAMDHSGKPIVFVSTGGSPWGGSEELWSQTALCFATARVPVAASVLKWPGGMPKQVRRLIQVGVQVQQREMQQGLLERVYRRAFRPEISLPAMELTAFLRNLSPGLVVLSAGGPLPPIEFIEVCVTNQWAFVTIGHNNFEHSWLDDSLAERYRTALRSASRCYFVSQSSVWLVEKQIGCPLLNCEVVRNPFNVRFDATINWPSRDSAELSMACVGSLDPGRKGQDLLFEALASPSWRERSWQLTLYGDGPSKNVLNRLVERLSLSHRVAFAGHVSSIENIWNSNHLLAQPSRQEAMPLSVIEAMLCGRPVIATDVAGHSEIIEDGVSGFLADAPTKTSLARALERVWEQRAVLEKMGQEAAIRIRQCIPADPAGVFFEKLERIRATSHKHSVPSDAGIPHQSS
jgi:glycosyltransferase involved in cell wall biosynthesis